MSLHSAPSLGHAIVPLLIGRQAVVLDPLGIQPEEPVLLPSLAPEEPPEQTHASLCAQEPASKTKGLECSPYLGFYLLGGGGGGGEGGFHPLKPFGKWVGELPPPQNFWPIAVWPENLAGIKFGGLVVN